jgi:hypothetical protein
MCMQRTLGGAIALAASSLDTPVSPEEGFCYNAHSDFAAVVTDIVRRAYMVATLVPQGEPLNDPHTAAPARVSHAPLLGAGERDGSNDAAARHRVVRWQILSRSSGTLYPQKCTDGTALRVELAVRVALLMGASAWASGWDKVYYTSDEHVPLSLAGGFRSMSFVSSTAAELQLFVFEELVVFCLAQQSLSRTGDVQRQRHVLPAAQDPFQWLTRCRLPHASGGCELERALSTVLGNASVRARFVMQLLESEWCHRGVGERTLVWRSDAMHGAHSSLLEYYDAGEQRLVVPEHVLWVLCRQWLVGTDRVPESWVMSSRNGSAPRRAGGASLTTRVTSSPVDRRALRGLPVGAADFYLPVQPTALLDDDVIFPSASLRDPGTVALRAEKLPFHLVSMFLAVVAADVGRIVASSSLPPQRPVPATLQLPARQGRRVGSTGTANAPGSVRRVSVATPRGRLEPSIEAVHHEALRSHQSQRPRSVRVELFTGSLQRHPALAGGISQTQLPAVEQDALMDLHHALTSSGYTVLAYFNSTAVSRHRAFAEEDAPPFRASDELAGQDPGLETRRRVVFAATDLFGLTAAAGGSGRHPRDWVRPLRQQDRDAVMVRDPDAAVSDTTAPAAAGVAAAAPTATGGHQHSFGNGLGRGSRASVLADPETHWSAAWMVESTDRIPPAPAPGDPPCQLEHHVRLLRCGSTQRDPGAAYDGAPSLARLGRLGDEPEGTCPSHWQPWHDDGLVLLNHRCSACACSDADHSVVLPSAGAAAAPMQLQPRCRFVVSDTTRISAAATGADPGVAIEPEASSTLDVLMGHPVGAPPSESAIAVRSFYGRTRSSVHELLDCTLLDISDTITPSSGETSMMPQAGTSSVASAGHRNGTGAGMQQRQQRHLRGEDRLVTTASTSGERLLLSVTRDIFSSVLGLQPFCEDLGLTVQAHLVRDWTLHDCQSLRWWVVQACLFGTLLPGPSNRQGST